ncbi:MAG: saccharopine dehydrogenase NADP-binding domain-containing protein [Actinobacteria bacterium]|nr:saccharopine dehydrogenase NADP-binding domain-containing protein [Actinomycetota bacterium]MBU1944558.1 saccharopine dehydrogenase NADP-binding domain-containing protein [Actinomycetota bacterium]MBU2689111.1 saccharopine dehydrogenase NADP-binding domain-containing protein [Actinomycetota bacterium]
MRVVALGGAGVMGRFGVRDLVSKDSVEELLIADYDIEAARAVASELGAKCSARGVDANDHEQMVSTVKGYDVAMGTIGPFYKYEKKVARACIDAGVDYVSICDDYDAAAAFLELDAEAKKAGVTAITGVGWTPGITNVFARLGADQLDEVDEIATSWACDPADTAGKAVTLHYIHAVTGMIPSFIDGRLAYIKAGSGLEKIRFPETVGECNVFHAGHPEPVTIPHFINARTVSLKGGLTDPFLVGLTSTLVGMGLTKTERRKDLVGGFFNKILPYLESIGKPPVTCSACRTDITGKKDGKWTHLAYGAAEHMDKLTCLPTSIVVQMVGEGLITEKGALPPEACVDPREFLKRLAEGGVRIFEGDEMVKPLEV